MQRAFDEVIHDVCGQNLPVTFCIDRAGVSGSDGETHQGVFDLSYLAPIPNLTIAIPANISEFRAMLRMSTKMNAPLAIRYPREGEEGAFSPVEIGKFDILHSNMSDIIIYAAGERCLHLAEQIYRRAQEEGIALSVVNARFLKPLDTELLDARPERYVITIEDNALIGGLGDAIARHLRNRGKEIYSFGYGDAFIPHGDARGLFAEFGPNEEKILACVRDCHARG